MKITMIKVEEHIHQLAKTKAKELGMTLQGYLKSLVLKDQNA